MSCDNFVLICAYIAIIIGLSSFYFILNICHRCYLYTLVAFNCSHKQIWFDRDQLTTEPLFELNDSFKITLLLRELTGIFPCLDYFMLIQSKLSCKISGWVLPCHSHPQTNTFSRGLPRLPPSIIPITLHGNCMVLVVGCNAFVFWLICNLHWPHSS